MATLITEKNQGKKEQKFSTLMTLIQENNHKTPREQVKRHDMFYDYFSKSFTSINNNINQHKKQTKGYRTTLEKNENSTRVSSEKAKKINEKFTTIFPASHREKERIRDWKSFIITNSQNHINEYNSILHTFKNVPTYKSNPETAITSLYDTPITTVHSKHIKKTSNKHLSSQNHSKTSSINSEIDNNSNYPRAMIFKQSSLAHKAKIKDSAFPSFVEDDIGEEEKVSKPTYFHSKHVSDWEINEDLIYLVEVERHNNELNKVYTEETHLSKKTKSKIRKYISKKGFICNGFKGKMMFKTKKGIGDLDVDIDDCENEQKLQQESNDGKSLGCRCGCGCKEENGGCTIY